MLAICALNTAAIRRERDAVRETQTDPISLKKKLEELKDGEKGPTTHTFEFYKAKDIQMMLPVDTKTEEDSQQAARKDVLPAYGDPVPENLEGIEAEDAAPTEDWWSESWGDEGQGQEEPPPEDSGK